jgi:glycosyltransferase involved in cell wall biosynthesis
MRVLLDTTFARRGPSGTGVYIESLAAALAAEGVDVLEAWNRRRRAPGAGGARSVANLAGDEWWTAVGLPRAARAAAADLIHHPLPAWAPWAPCPQVVTVHDLAFVRLPELFDRRYAAWAARAHRLAARRADAVVCVSEATRHDLAELWGVAGLVAHHGPGQAPRVPPPRTAARHYLYVGDDEPRKDLRTLRAAHAALGPAAPPLVLAGSAGGRALDATALALLQASAIALVHPARSEGFGLTVLEAMAMGTPVIAARCAAVEEVGGDAIAWFEPGDVAGLAAQMGLLAADAALRDRLGRAGLERAARFSWRTSARRHIEAYTLACR